VVVSPEIIVTSNTDSLAVKVAVIVSVSVVGLVEVTIVVTVTVDSGWVVTFIVHVPVFVVYVTWVTVFVTVFTPTCPNIILLTGAPARLQEEGAEDVFDVEHCDDVETVTVVVVGVLPAQRIPGRTPAWLADAKEEPREKLSATIITRGTTASGLSDFPVSDIFRCGFRIEHPLLNKTFSRKLFYHDIGK